MGAYVPYMIDFTINIKAICLFFSREVQPITKTPGYRQKPEAMVLACQTSYSFLQSIVH